MRLWHAIWRKPEIEGWLMDTVVEGQRARRIRVKHRLPVPRVFLGREEIGLGDLVKAVTSRFGLAPCEPCLRRAERMNGVLLLVSGNLVASSPCTTFKGACTGMSGERQCVTAPRSLEPDAPTVTQCCSGRFQYPVVEVCPGQEPSLGCGFCLF
jgi:hypothetical protein